MIKSRGKVKLIAAFLLSQVLDFMITYLKHKREKLCPDLSALNSKDNIEVDKFAVRKGRLRPPFLF